MIKCIVIVFLLLSPYGQNFKNAEEMAAYAAFYALIETSAHIPDGTRLLGAYLEDGELTVDVSAEITRYGGTENEISLVNELLAAARPFAERFTLLIEGIPRVLPEGTEIYERAVP